MKALSTKQIAAVFAIFLLIALYIVVYISISMHGRYEPAFIGCNGVKQYDWAPSGFVNNYKWNTFMLKLFFPLHAIDLRYWHKTDDSYSGKYPINKVDKENIGDVYRAWSR
jgi:hypothetical protein